MKNIQISNIHFKPALPTENAKGLIGWVTCTLNGRLQLDGIAVRRTRGRKLTLSFPCRQDRFGQQHFIIRPLDDAARRVIERQVFQALRLIGRAS